MNLSPGTLHTVNKSAFGSDALASCRRVARPGDAILLLEDGVYNAVDASILVGAGLTRDASETNQSRARPAPTASFGGIKVYALREDLRARGITAAQLPAHIEPITYEDFVALVCTYARTVSWF